MPWGLSRLEEWRIKEWGIWAPSLGFYPKLGFSVNWSDRWTKKTQSGLAKCAVRFKNKEKSSKWIFYIVILQLKVYDWAANFLQIDGNEPLSVPEVRQVRGDRFRQNRRSRDVVDQRPPHGLRRLQGLLKEAFLPKDISYSIQYLLIIFANICWVYYYYFFTYVKKYFGAH